jgi:hypothetical protein
MIKTDTITSNALISDQTEVLYSIHDKNCNITIFERNIGPLVADIDAFILQDKAIKVKGTFEKISQIINAHFKTNSELKKDVINLLRHFKNITQTNELSLFLAKVDSDMCRKFHTDMNDLRMLCTYHGKGTLWLPEDNNVRKSLYSNPQSNQDVINPNLIQHVKTGAVAIFKGALYPKEGTKAAIHKSPSIEANNEHRLLLRIDTNDFLPNLIN